MAEAETAIKSLLETQADNLATTTSIWAILAPSDAAKPYLSYEVLTETPVNVMGSETAPTEVLFQVNIFTDTFLQTVTVTNDVRTALNRFSGTTDSVVVQDVFYENRSDNFDESDNDYQRTLDFRMWFEE
tara:strand:- start:284 stop:673 length:390 start_codon:yes stop_codon:yes gene_type:complete